MKINPTEIKLKTRRFLRDHKEGLDAAQGLVIIAGIVTAVALTRRGGTVTSVDDVTYSDGKAGLVVHQRNGKTSVWTAK